MEIYKLEFDKINNCDDVCLVYIEAKNIRDKSFHSFANLIHKQFFPTYHISFKDDKSVMGSFISITDINGITTRSKGHRNKYKRDVMFDSELMEGKRVILFSCDSSKSMYNEMCDVYLYYDNNTSVFAVIKDRFSIFDRLERFVFDQIDYKIEKILN